MSMPESLRSALIGHSGFVGSTLKRQHQFDDYYRSKDIQCIAGKAYDLVVCAGAPAQKWLANQKPEEDRASIDRLIEALSTVNSGRFVLISTVDVHANPNGVDELSPVDTVGLHPYGLHRHRLEQFIEQRFSCSLVLRLPGLVGPGLRKNIIYDIHNDNDVLKNDSRSVFQFYPVVNLWADIQAAMGMGIGLLHLTAEPISVSEVSEKGFGIPFANLVADCPASYDFRSRYATQAGGEGQYTYSKRETLQAIRTYAQSEPRRRAASCQTT